MRIEEVRRFQNYLFLSNNPYTPNPEAITDEVCRQFAEQIINLWDSFYYENNEPDNEEMAVHLNNYLTLLLSELPESSPLIEHVRAELRNQEKELKEETDMYDHLMRIRGVFGLEGTFHTC